MLLKESGEEGGSCTSYVAIQQVELSYVWQYHQIFDKRLRAKANSSTKWM